MIEDFVDFTPLIVVRHSERMDEVNMKEWEELLEQDSLWRATDPPITTNGINIARNAAEKIILLIGETLSNGGRKFKEIRIYSSMLLRAIQTAHQIALKLSLPVHLSSGLATISASVRKAGDSFPFQPLERLRSLCPGVEYIICDDNKNAETSVPRQNWRDALRYVCCKDKDVLNIVVAHRETIKKLAGKKLNTPYCCVALFQPQWSTSKQATGTSSQKSPEAASKDSADLSAELGFKFISKK
mmetsp:Transcript_6517/g.9091  ORF Transcript_6517/g.9091 Transcript_6517/m.9091 type:complete len:243 (+) Transcript_6517:1958-2686(+)